MGEDVSCWVAPSARHMNREWGFGEEAEIQYRVIVWCSVGVYASCSLFVGQLIRSLDISL